MDTDTVIKDVRPNVRLMAYVATQSGREELLNAHGFKPFGESLFYFEKFMDVTYVEAIEYARSLRSVAGVKNVGIVIAGEGMPVMLDPPDTGGEGDTPPGKGWGQVYTK